MMKKLTCALCLLLALLMQLLTHTEIIAIAQHTRYIKQFGLRNKYMPAL